MTSSPSGDELRLTITPYGYIEWRGPRARIEATGLLPANFKWPARIDYADWHADGFAFWLRRCRPDGLMGPMRYWMKCDYWVVHRVMPRHLEDTWRIHQPYRELGDLLFHASHAGQELSINFSKVHADERIDRFEARLVPRPMKRRRRAKGR